MQFYECPICDFKTIDNQIVLCPYCKIDLMEFEIEIISERLSRIEKIKISKETEKMEYINKINYSVTDKIVYQNFTFICEALDCIKYISKMNKGLFYLISEPENHVICTFKNGEEI